MQWSVIVVVPIRFKHRSLQDISHYYQFELPIIADGRLAHLQLKLNPQRAAAWRFEAGKPALQGLVRLIDNQWSCIWDQKAAQRLGVLRVLGGRFGLGDVVGLRPVGGALSLFTVSTVLPAQPEKSESSASFV
jgi:hypothetical protein